MARFINWSAHIILIVGLWALLAPTSLGGPASWVIVDGRSMEPTYSHGDLVIARQQSSYSVGDVIVYDAPVDAQFNVIHRIIDRTNGGFVTQGDNRSTPDGWIAPSNTIHGAAWMVLPGGGRFIVLLRQPAVIIGLVAGLLTFELLKLTEEEEGRDAAASPLEAGA